MHFIIKYSTNESNLLIFDNLYGEPKILDLANQAIYTRARQLNEGILEMAKLTTVFWRDIPAQVIAKEKRESAKVVLSDRFAEAIDRAAMRAKMAGTDAYLEQWHHQVTKCGTDLQATVDEAAQNLEQEYSDERLAGLVQNGGAEA